MPAKVKTKRAPSMPSLPKAYDLRALVQSSRFRNFETLAAKIGCSPVTLYAAANEKRLPRQRAIRNAVAKALKLDQSEAVAHG